MKHLIEEIKNNGLHAIKSADDLDSLNNARIKFLGKSGELTAVLRNMKNLSDEERPLIGKAVNIVRDMLAEAFEEKLTRLEQLRITKKLERESIDITMEGTRKLRGGLHPCSLVMNEIFDIFTQMGFAIKSGNEIETDYFNFQALNIPKDHPAREMQDTFFITEDILLRTHTSPTQARTMISEKPPIKMLNPGKVYRPDDDATHSPMFQQIEGLVVDEGITMCDLKGVLEAFAKKLFNENTKTRLRPSFFPFTEPSVEVDVTCAVCGGKGCRVCKGTGWIEILGAGIVNPKVLENCGIDSKLYSGFAFGLGIERIAMIKYGIPDMRILFDDDIRFLKQFN